MHFRLDLAVLLKQPVKVCSEELLVSQWQQLGQRRFVFSYLFACVCVRGSK